MTSTLVVLGSHGTIASLVTAFLAHPKTLDGTPRWQIGNRPTERRIRWAVFVNGSSSGATLDMTGHPAEPERFMVGLSFPTHIWRIDHETRTRAPHPNPLDQIERLGVASIQGPHFHSWTDNAYLATPKNLPPELLCARPLPPTIQGFGNVLRWFCGQTNIRLDVGQMIDLPRRDTLL